MQNLLNDLMLLLERDLRLVAEGKLLKNKIVELALALDAGLIKLLLSHDAIKKHFFVEVENVLVFDKIKFQRFVSNKQFLPDSYTAYKNKIGLTANGDYLTESKEVVLAWPYKDCVLEGGQDKEDAKRNEVFWNETLAPDQIDRLLAPKLLTGFKRYDQDGEHAVTELSLDDNLIIKGNNLLALHTLKEVYAGKVKLIYIDPPYNTGSDSFGYNDSFNHSAWLTFMQNRLEVASKLLSLDGFIFIQCDDSEQAYLKVLCDDIFGREAYINSVCVKMSHLSGVKMSHTEKTIPKIKEFLIAFSKSQNFRIEQQYEAVPWNEALDRYTQFIINKDKAVNEWRYLPVMEVAKSRKINFEDAASYESFLIENAKCIFRTARNNSLIKTGVRNTFSQIKSATGLDKIILNDEEVIFASEKVKLINGEMRAANTLGDIWLDIAINNLHNEGEVSFKNGKKPEKIIQRIISMTTMDGDLILDFHLGSGTTAAVAHKMGRRYIGVEQMDYIETITLERLKKVIAGEQGGISKAVNWQGGGSFVYCELSQANQEFIDQIQAATSSAELQTIWQTMQEKAFLSHQLNPKIIDANASEFAQLAFADQQRFLIEVLDKNLLYVPYSEMDDASYAVSEQDKALNKQFFNLK
jgi:adenine-specific DNA-methyltransferase